MGWRAVLLVILFTGSPAHAERELFGGLNVRTDLGTQFVRAGGSLRFDRLSFDAVVDPYGYWSGEQHDTELLAGWDLWSGGWAVLAGWRVSSVPLLGIRYYQEKLVVGTSAPLGVPPFRWLRARIGAEWALTVVRHGSEVPTFWVWSEDELHGGSFNVGLFLRLEAGGPI